LKILFSYIFQNESNVIKLIRNEVIFIDDEDEIQKLIKIHHSSVYGAHVGVYRCLERIKKIAKFSNMKAKILEFIQKCPNCQTSKTSIKPKRNINITDLGKSPFSKISVDIVGPLTPSQEGYTYILSIYDTFSHFYNAIPIKDTTSETIVVNLIYNHFLIYSFSDCIIMDNAKNLNSLLTQRIAKLFNYKTINTTIYNPAANPVERVHKELGINLKIFINQQQSSADWPSYVKFFNFSYNNHINVTGHSPFEIVFGKEMNVPYEDVNIITEPEYNYDSFVFKLKNTLKSLHKMVENKMFKIKEQKVSKHNENARSLDFKIGEIVKTTNFKQTDCSKFKNKYIAPCEIVGVSDDYCHVKINGQVKKINKNHIFKYYTDEQ
jgi:hypothetical protein